MNEHEVSKSGKDVDNPQNLIYKFDQDEDDEPEEKKRTSIKGIDKENQKEKGENYSDEEKENEDK